MICAFEFLHFLPLLVVLLSVFLLKVDVLLPSFMIIIASAIGMLAGQHMHTEHMHAYTAFDPCYLYFIASAFAVYQIAKVAFVKIFAKA